MAMAMAMTLAPAGLHCGGQPRLPAAAPLPLDDVHIEAGRPPLALIARDGDPTAAFAVAVSTEGIAGARAPEVTLALATLLDQRLRAAWPSLESRPGFDNFELRGLAPDGALDALFVALDRAMKGPVTAPELEPVRKKLALLAKKAVPDAALREIARCRGEAVGPPFVEKPAELSLADLESWRAAAFGLERVGFAFVGTGDAAKRAANGLGKMAPWSASTKVEASAPSPLPSTALVESAGLLGPREARAHVYLHAADATRAVAAARDLGATSSPLSARLSGLDGAPRVDEITGTAALAGGCIAISLDFGAVDLAAPSSTSRIATAIALVEQELAHALADSGDASRVGRAIAREAADPREAAERAAWWTLIAAATHRDPVVPRENAPPRAVVVYGTPKDKSAFVAADAERSLQAATERAAAALDKPVITARSRVEAGQSELWMLLASACGTGAEVVADSGLAAAFARASANSGATPDVTLEPWTVPDAIGVVAHGPALPNETPAVQARRIADVAARAFAADPIDERAVARVRATLRPRLADPRARALFVLGDAIAPGHPSWLVADGNPDAMARVSVASLAARAAALREGPLRAAVIANVDEAQANAAVRAADRWIARRPEGVRACPTPNSSSAPKPGTYSVDAPGMYEAYLAFPILDPSPAGRNDAEAIADALDGDGGLLGTALVSAGLARTATARVMGGPYAAALVINIASTEAGLDGAVAQTRALLDRIRKGALTDADVTQGSMRRNLREQRANADPRARLSGLFTGRAPATPVVTAAALATSAAKLLTEDAMIVVAMRPPRPRTN